MQSDFVAALVRRHAHDLRNSLNGIEMELILLSETSAESERHILVKRAREEIRRADLTIRSFAAKFVSENKLPIGLADITEMWMSDARSLLPDVSITWKTDVADAAIEADPILLRSVLGDLMLLAARRCICHVMAAECHVVRGQAVFGVSCPLQGDDAPGPDVFEDVLWLSLHEFATTHGGSLQSSTANGRLSCCLSLPERPQESAATKYESESPVE